MLDVEQVRDNTDKAIEQNKADEQINEYDIAGICRIYFHSFRIDKEIDRRISEASSEGEGSLHIEIAAAYNGLKNVSYGGKMLINYRIGKSTSTDIDASELWRQIEEKYPAYFENLKKRRQTFEAIFRRFNSYISELVGRYSDAGFVVPEVEATISREHPCFDMLSEWEIRW